MKKIFSLFAAVLFAGSMMAEGLLFEQTYPGEPSEKVSAYTKSFTMTTNGYTLTYANINNGSSTDNPAWDALRAGRKNNASVATITSEAIAEKVSKVVIDFTQVNANLTNELYLQVAASADFAGATKISATIAVGEVEFVIAEPAENLFYQIVIDQAAGSANGFNRFDKVQFISPDGGTPIVPPTYETINVAQALELAGALADGASSPDKYYVEGYAVAVQAYSTQYGNQIFFMADAVDAAENARIQAYGAYPEKDGKVYPVLEGDKVRALGKLKKFVNSSGTQLEIINPSVEFLEEVEGDRTIEPVVEANAVFLPADFKDQGKAATEEDPTGGEVSATKNGVTVAANSAYGHEKALRVYAKSSLSITSETEQIGKLVFSFANVNNKTYDGGLEAEIVVNAKEWSVESLASQARIEKLEVYFGEYEKPVDPEVPELPEGVLTCAGAVEAAAAIADPTADNKTVKGDVVKVRGFVTFAYDAKDGKQSAWLGDTKGGEGLIQAYNAAITDAVNKGDYVEVEGSLAKFYKAADNTVLELLDGSMSIIVGGGGVTPQPQELDTITVAKALEIGGALEDGKTTEKEYVIKGYVSNIVDAYSVSNNNETFWLAAEKESTAASNADGAFYVFRGRPKDSKAIGLHALVCVTCKIKKYVKEGQDPIIENEKANCPVNVLEEGEEEQIESINVARALEIGQALQESTDNQHSYPSDARYEITGYVSSIVEMYSSFGNETFWITDTKGARTSDKTVAFEVYRGKPNTQAEIGLDAKIRIVCKIKNFKGTIENDGTNIDFEVLEQGTLNIEDIDVATAIEKASALDAGAVSTEFYNVHGYVKSISSPYDESFKNMSIYLTDDFDNPGQSEQSFQVFRGKISAEDAAKVEVGTYVVVTGHLDNNSHGLQMASGAQIELAEAPVIETIDVNVAEALAIGEALDLDQKSDKLYRITGYVTYAGEYDEDDQNQTFWLDDQPGAEATGIKAELTSVPGEFSSNMQVKIVLIGRIQKYKNEYDEVEIRVLRGTASWGEGIENVVLTEKAQKVVVDGVIYIIRDNKMFNLQGTQVR